MLMQKELYTFDRIEYQQSEREMKFNKKMSLGITLVSMMLLVTIGLVNAQTPAIGASAQPDPYESNPSTVTYSGLVDPGPTNPGNMYDGSLGTFGNFYLGDSDVSGYVQISGFDLPATQWTPIGWVDIKMKYLVSAYDPDTADDPYSIEYQVSDSAWVPLQSTTTSQFDTATPPLAQIRPWAEVREPNDGTWSWADVQNLKVKVSFDIGVNEMSDFREMDIYELWATVHKPPLPPSASPTLSIQPRNMTKATWTGRRFFVEIFAQDVTALVGYQFTINFNTTVLSPVAGQFYAYYPFVFQGALTLNNTGGYVSAAFSIPVSDPLATTGLSGNLSLCRVYFLEDASPAGSRLYDWLTFSVSLMGKPGAIRITHHTYHMFYGKPPADTYLFGWTPSSNFPYMDPISTYWIEQYPDLGKEWHLSSHTDNGAPGLNPSDQVDMTDLGTSKKSDFHVEKIWDCFVDAPTLDAYATYMIVTKKPEVPEFPLGTEIVLLLAPIIAIVYIWRLRKNKPKPTTTQTSPKGW